MVKTGHNLPGSIYPLMGKPTSFSESQFLVEFQQLKRITTTMEGKKCTYISTNNDKQFQNQKSFTKLHYLRFDTTITSQRKTKSCHRTKPKAIRPKNIIAYQFQFKILQHERPNQPEKPPPETSSVQIQPLKPARRPALRR